MELGLIGLGRMGANMATRLLRAGHRVILYNRTIEKAQELAEAEGGHAAESVAELVAMLTPPRVVWLMLPAGDPTETQLDHLIPLLHAGDIVVDGANSNFHDSIARAARLQQHRLQFVDAGVSGGIWGLQNGYCMMLGGQPEAIAALTPALNTLAPPDGWLHCGSHGAGHYVKMIHNGIEYGMMQAYAEGFEILRASRYDFDLGAVAHLWNQGSVVRSWLLELAERAFAEDADLSEIKGYVQDSGEGRWTVKEAIDLDVPAPVITLSLQARFRSRQAESFGARVLAALRNQFGGHAVVKSE